MTRLRSKGNAAPATLYDLLNGYITIAGSINARPGTQTEITLPSSTKGLVAHKSKLYTFNHVPAETSNPDKYVVAVLRHPTDPSIALEQIHFAAALDAWSASTDYMIGDRVFPETENGYAYKATRPGSPNEAWAANVERSVGDIVEPTTYNGFKYTVIATTGTNPTSGSTEPD
jgi:hypothetical protein